MERPPYLWISLVTTSVSVRIPVTLLAAEKAPIMSNFFSLQFCKIKKKKKKNRRKLEDKMIQ